MGTISILYKLLKRTDRVARKEQADGSEGCYARRLRIWAFVVSLFVLTTGVFAYFLVVAPLQRQLLSEQVRAAAKSVDSIVKARGVSVSTVGRTLDLENLMSENGGEQAISALRDQFPDFLSLEVMNGEGALLAMFGDLSLAEARRKSRSEDLAASGSEQDSESERFQDYPQGKCFFITTKQTSTEGNTWFVRARFSREPIEKALAVLGAHGTAQLQSASSLPLDWPSDGFATGAAIKGGESSETPSVTVSRKWWGGETKATALLVTPEWAITVRGYPAEAFPSRYFVVGLCTLALLLVGYMAIRHWAAGNKATASAAPEQPGSLAQPGAMAEAIPEEPVGIGVSEVGNPVPEEGSEAIPEFLEVDWLEPDIDAGLPRKRQNEYISPSSFAGS